MYFPPVSKFLSIMYLLSKDSCHSYPVIYRFDVKKFTNNTFVFLIDFSLTLLSNNVIVEIFLSFFLTALCRFLIINHYKYRMDSLLKIYIYIWEYRFNFWNETARNLILPTDIANNRTTIISTFSFFSFVHSTVLLEKLRITVIPRNNHLIFARFRF